MDIHPTAVIEDGVILGADVQLGPHAYIAEGAVLGDRCSVGPNAVIYGSVTMGSDCKVHAGTVIGDDPQDLAFSGEPTFVKIGDHCTFRETMTVHRGTAPGSTTTIGNNCYFMACSHVGHNCTIEDGVILVNGALLAGHVHIGEKAFISGNAGVHQFCSVGRLAILGGASIATTDVPPFCTVRTAGLNTLSGLNTIGLRRAGIAAGERTELKKVYRLIFREGKNLREAVAECRALFPESDTVSEFCDFIENSKRGVCTHS